MFTAHPPGRFVTLLGRRLVPVMPLTVRVIGVTVGVWVTNRDKSVRIRVVLGGSTLPAAVASSGLTDREGAGVVAA